MVGLCHIHSHFEALYLLCQHGLTLAFPFVLERALEQLYGMKNIQMAGMFAAVCVDHHALVSPQETDGPTLKIASGPSLLEKVSLSHARLLRSLQLKDWAAHVCMVARLPLSRLEGAR